MKKAESEPLFRRVLVPLDAGPVSRSLLELSADLAFWFETPLAGLFIEDEDLLSFADLPFAREVSLGGAVLRDITRQHVQSHYRTQASLARRHLETIAAERRVACSFELKRGRCELEIHAAAERSDLVVALPTLGALTGWSVEELSKRLLKGPAAGLLALPKKLADTRSGPLIAVQSASPMGQQTLHIAGRIAARSGRPVYLLDASGQLSESRSTGALQDLAGAGGLAKLIVPKGGESLPESLQREALWPSLIVVPGDLPDEEQRGLARLGAPLLVVCGANPNQKE